MKKAIGLGIILLIWIGSVSAGELKVKVPVEEFEQMKTRLETLENEKVQLQEELKTLSDKTTDEEMKEQVESLSQENKQLQQKVESMAEKTSKEASYAKEKDNRLDTMGRENRQLKRAVASLKESGALLRSDRRTARQVYFQANKKFASHIFK